MKPLPTLPLNPTLTALAFDPMATGHWLSLSSSASDAFLAKLSSDGRDTFFSTYFGGSGADAATGIALDAYGVVSIVGNTNSRDLNGSRNDSAGMPKAFVANFSPDGAEIISAQYVGGSR